MITNVTCLEIVDTSQGDRTIIVPSRLGYRRMTVRIRKILWALQGHPAVTLWAPHDYRKSLRSFLGQNDIWGSYDVTVMCLHFF